MRHLNELIASGSEDLIDDFAPMIGHFHKAIVVLEMANEDPGLEGMDLALLPRHGHHGDDGGAGVRRQARATRRRRPVAAAEVTGPRLLVHRVWESMGSSGWDGSRARGRRDG